MADEATQPAAEAAKGGGGLKIVLIAVIAILLVGAIAAYIILKPEPPIVMAKMTWPSEGGGGEGEGAPKPAKPLELKCTLSDGSYAVVADIRFETAPVDVENHGKEVMEEFETHKSAILSLMTEVANELNQTNVNNTQVFRNNLKKKINEELEHAEVEKVLIENWMATPIN